MLTVIGCFVLKPVLNILILFGYILNHFHIHNLIMEVCLWITTIKDLSETEIRAGKW